MLSKKSIEINQIYSLVVFKPLDHKSGQEKFLRRTSEGLHVNFHENFIIVVCYRNNLFGGTHVPGSIRLMDWGSFYPNMWTLALKLIIAYLVLCIKKSDLTIEILSGE